MFVVVSVYYKHGEYSVDTYDSEEELREAVESQVEGYDQPNEYFPPMKQLEKLTIPQLCSMMIKAGKTIIEKQDGYGWVSIVKNGQVME